MHRPHLQPSRCAPLTLHTSEHSTGQKQHFRGLGFHPMGSGNAFGVLASGHTSLHVPPQSGTEPTTKPPLLISSGAWSHPIINLPYPKSSFTHRKCCLHRNTQAATEAQSMNSTEGLFVSLDTEINFPFCFCRALHRAMFQGIIHPQKAERKDCAAWLWLLGTPSAVNATFLQLIIWNKCTSLNRSPRRYSFPWRLEWKRHESWRGLCSNTLQLQIPSNCIYARPLQCILICVSIKIIHSILKPLIMRASQPAQKCLWQCDDH